MCETVFVINCPPPPLFFLIVCVCLCVCVRACVRACVHGNWVVV